VAVAVLVWPAVRVQMGLDRAVRAVALDWRDFGRQPAEARLQVELARLGAERARCGFLDAEEGRAVHCAMVVEVGVGEALRAVPVAARAELAPSGDLK
jgi:hypothetical protein